MVSSTPSLCATPVLIIAYRRADTTLQVIEALRKVRPTHLYIACNAPNPARPSEVALCDEVRGLFDQIDWPCQQTRLFRVEHLPARDSISSAISWFFQNVERGIVLEDDCIPSASFFQFAEELLARYADDKRIGMISGDNFQFGRQRGPASYYFSRTSHIWGWATWRDRWADYDLQMRSWPEHRQQILGSLDHPLQRRYWGWILDRTHAGLIDTWDYQWIYTNWYQNRVSIVPQVNMVSNIGFGNMANHTHQLTRDANIPAAEISFPLIHPNGFLPSREADNHTFWSSYMPGLPSLWRYAMKRIGLTKRR
jgi:hypothetical protein